MRRHFDVNPCEVLARIHLAAVISVAMPLMGCMMCKCGIQPPVASPPPPSPWLMTWHDEFDQPDGSRPDPAKWTFSTGGGGWGNDELEYHTNRLENAHIEKGNLVITAKQENYTGADGVTREYTSARMKTQGLFAQAYGRFEARIKIPEGQGIWPAFWMLGSDIPDVAWPKCGEIDVMENIGKEPATVHGSVHGPLPGKKASDLTSSFSLPTKARFADDFHVYALEWAPETIKFFVDDMQYATFNPQSSGGGPWVFDHPFFILLNVAVGGDWPGNPDATTKFPQNMLVDYVRVYKRR